MLIIVSDAEMSYTYEIEIKSLLGSKENADELKKKLIESPLKFSPVSKHSQLNHYFNTPEDFSELEEALAEYIPEDKKEVFRKIIKESKKVSVRTREMEGKVILVMKASVGDDTSANGVSRIEFETEVDVKGIDDLDKLLLDAGLTFQAKWSREREEYKSEGMNVCIDKNAGYGYLAEFEKILSEGDDKESAKDELLKVMNEFGVLELEQDRLERMFAHYNEHWSEYYGTDKVFNIE